ncbi:hypothetical protein CDAR_107211 [Caerostris darwini]|uniref:Uncharacterized protein n=1 Tax=Caerostris darwini TaxID=1538125 RepID=A0AAV4SY19_9ARAC|nr:hypothetical protein CDAR_107211 [Caerostris darwini]
MKNQRRQMINITQQRSRKSQNCPSRNDTYFTLWLTNHAITALQCNLLAPPDRNGARLLLDKAPRTPSLNPLPRFPFLHGAATKGSN